MILALTFTKSLRLILLQPVETSLMLMPCMETALLKELLFLALADINHKTNQCTTTRGALNSVCTKLELASSESKEILEINVLQKLAPMLFVVIHI